MAQQFVYVVYYEDTQKKDAVFRLLRVFSTKERATGFVAILEKAPYAEMPIPEGHYAVARVRMN
ncbi:MAG: hypothetical protein LKJ06_01800 [Schleiferilactobacillus harbinensis]|jgi:hypothetical protein|uniref:Uncharacterized protein n=1 Tax=Schleiferilactobacillus perolens DSM 12744 TaxID=1423792 RepID=A0A0R1MYP6_9LACO|nr:hypothetical protein [Schleiferilactobacillus perolens]KRL12972.1 hypothetical protein FD09_GL002512 [Schleiferilactobacillus perolens DSM 12744]MCI1911745.1 hypothetical protein [Schleiferilactobacillus harbinensis]